MILIAYDGSDDAKAAVGEASKLFPGEQATVLTVWQRFIDVMARSGAAATVMLDYEEIDQSAEEFATERADEGAKLGVEQGLSAEGKTTVANSNIAEAILHEANAVSAKAIVIGTRGLSGVKSFLLGSTSHAVLQRSDVPVVVIPSPVVAAERAKNLRDHE